MWNIDFDDLVTKTGEAYENIFLLAIKKQIDLRDIVDSVAEKVEESVEDDGYFVPRGFEGILFLFAVLNEMDVSITDAFCMSELERKRIIEGIIEEIEDEEIEEYEGYDGGETFTVTHFFGNAEYKFTFRTLKLPFAEECSFSMTITQEIYTDSSVLFQTNLMYDSVSIGGEESGRLCQYITETIEDYLQEHEDEEEYEFETEENQTNDYTDEIIDYRDFFIHSNNRNCNHEYEKVMATVPVYKYGRVDKVSFEAEYCPDCGIYYISDYTYRYKILPAGRLLCQLMSLEDYREYKKQEFTGDLKPQSVLNMLGYNVNAKDNLSEHERRTILEHAIGSGVITKKTATNYLQIFIKKSEQRPQLRSAVAKWRSDLNWLQTQNGEGKIIYGVKRIIG